MRKDWIECALGEIFNITYGKGLPVKKLTDKGFPVFGANGVIGYYSEYKYKDEQVLISCRGAASGTINMSPKECFVTNNSLIVEIGERVSLNKKYLYFMLNGANRSKIVTGSAQPQVTINNAITLIIPIVPLPEQRAIVAKTEELFSSLDSGIADLKKAQDQLKIYRQAVLSSSFPNKKLVEISKVINDLTQGWSPKCLNQNSTNNAEWAVIKTTAIQASDFVEYENKILPSSLLPRKQHEIKQGDILITRAGPRVRVGICCLVKKTRPKLINCDKVYRIRLNTDLVVPEYFESCINSPEILSKIEKMKSGSSDSGLNLTQKVFLKLQIHLPSIQEQHKIVEEIERRLSVCDKVEESIVESLEKAKALRQSILKKAFEGRLLNDQEVAACKSAPDYEPASVLLKRIKAEKATGLKKATVSRKIIKEKN